MSDESMDRRKKQVKMKKMLIIMWAVFIPIVVVVAIFLFKNKDEVMEDMGLKGEKIYEQDAYPEVNDLVKNYFTAYAACDQMTLKGLVTDPSQYDDMTIVQKKAEVVTGYSNIKCYTIKGVNEGEMVVYVVSNISIANVVSTPLEMNPALYLVKKGNGASRTLIATTALSDTQLEDNEYYLVFAYNDNGNIKVISEQRQDNPGQVRWAMQVPADQYANENQLCIYALWVYPDGSRVTSGLLSFDGNADNAWDGSDYSHSTRGGDETGIQDLSMQRDSQGNLQESYTLTGMKSSHLVKGINIVRMNDGSIRKVYKK